MVFEQKFAFSLLVFCWHAAISPWFLLFFRFLGLDFLNGFPTPFIGLVFLFETKFHFSLVVFCSHMGISLWFSVFAIFFLIFFLNCAPNSLLVRSRTSFLFSQWKFVELYVRTWPAIFFSKISSHIFMIFEVKLEWWFWSRRNRKWSEKASGFAAWNFFALNLKWSEKTVFEQKLEVWWNKSLLRYSRAI